MRAPAGALPFVVAMSFAFFTAAFASSEEQIFHGSSDTTRYTTAYWRRELAHTTRSAGGRYFFVAFLSKGRGVSTPIRRIRLQKWVSRRVSKPAIAVTREAYGVPLAAFVAHSRSLANVLIERYHFGQQTKLPG